eukprot:jgi/Botrbrau1/18171/Bobra.53_1s0039.1
MVYVLRCSPLRAVAAGVAVFDDGVHSNLRRIVVGEGEGFGPLQEDIAALPLSGGALGITRAKDIVPVAFLASVLQTQGVQDEILAGCSAQVGPASFNYARRQALLAWPAQERVVEVLESAAQPHASGWLQALPVERMGQVMSHIELRCRLRYQLLVPMFQAGTPCPRCVMCMNRWGDHAVQCRVGRGEANTYRHNAVRDILFWMGKEVETMVVREPPLPVRVLGFEARRPDLMFQDWEGGRDLYIDVVGTSPLSPSYSRGGAGVVLGAGAARAAAGKLASNGGLSLPRAVRESISQAAAPGSLPPLLL